MYGSHYLSLFMFKSKFHTKKNVRDCCEGLVKSEGIFFWNSLQKINLLIYSKSFRMRKVYVSNTWTGIIFVIKCNTFSCACQLIHDFFCRIVVKTYSLHSSIFFECFYVFVFTIHTVFSIETWARPGPGLI